MIVVISWIICITVVGWMFVGLVRRRALPTTETRRGMPWWYWFGFLAVMMCASFIQDRLDRIFHQPFIVQLAGMLIVALLGVWFLSRVLKSDAAWHAGDKRDE